jgi:hypothetical protein
MFVAVLCSRPRLSDIDRVQPRDELFFCLDKGAHAIRPSMLGAVSQQSPDFRAFLPISLERFENEFRTIANSGLESF